MSKKLVVLGLAAFIFPAIASAATITVTATTTPPASVVPGSTSTEGCPTNTANPLAIVTCTLRAAVTAANGTPEADEIIFTGAGIGTHALVLPAITQPLTITGSTGVIVNGTNANPIFNVTGSGNYAFSLLTLQNGKSTNASIGGALTVGSTATVVVTNVTFTGNSAINGGAIYNNGSLSLNAPAVFTGNTATENGGAIYSLKPLSLVGTNIGGATGNSAKRGGGIYFNAPASSVLALNNVTLLRNAASGNGGGLFVGAGLTATVTGSSIDSNTSGALGGGIYASDATLTVTNTAIKNNAVNVTAPSTLGGGGLYIEHLIAGDTTLNNIVIENNNAANGNGGGLLINKARTDSQVMLSGVTVDGNDAVFGAGMLVSRGEINLRNTLFKFNAATQSGGAIYLLANAVGGSLNAENSTLSSNTAVVNGGGLGADPGVQSPSRLINTTIAFNTVSTAGGGAGIGLGTSVNAVLPASFAYPFTNNILAQNKTAGALLNCGNSLIFQNDPLGARFNIADDASCFGATPQTVLDAGLLAFNDMARTHPLRANSPAIDAANKEFATDFDQRGAPKVVGRFPLPTVLPVEERDIGAYEFAGFGAITFANDVAAFSKSEKSGTVQIPLRRFGNTTTTIAATFSTATDDRQGAKAATGGPAPPALPVAGQDYVTVAPTPPTLITFAAAGTEQNTPLVINDDLASADGDAEGDETLKLVLANPVGGADLGDPNPTFFTILNFEEGVFRFGLSTPTNEVASCPTTFCFIEGADPKVVKIKVKRLGGDDGAVSVNYATSNDTAMAGAHYLATAGTLNWADQNKNGVPDDSADPLNSNEREFNLSLKQSNGEVSRQFRITLGTATNGARVLAGDAVATVTLFPNNKNRFQFTEDVWNVREGDDQNVLCPQQNVLNTTVSVFVEPLAAVVDGPVALTLNTSDGTAVTPDDYLELEKTETWTTGQNDARRFCIEIVNGDDAESNESFNVTIKLDTPEQGRINGLATTPVNISEPQTVGFAAATFSSNGESATSVVTAMVSRTGDMAGAISVDYEVIPDTAVAADFENVIGTLNWADGDTAPKAVTVTVKTDTLIEGDETFTIKLKNQSPVDLRVIGDTATGVIRDDDSRFVVVSKTVNVTEGTDATAAVVFRREGGTFGVASPSYDYGSGTDPETDTAGSPGDYRVDDPRPVIAWANGDSADKTLLVPIENDAIREANETFTVRLINGGVNDSGEMNSLGLPPSDITAKVNIATDDPIRFEVLPLAQTKLEADGMAVVTVKVLDAFTHGVVSITYDTVNGTAIQPGDYTARTGALTFSAGAADREMPVTIPIIADGIVELDEQFSLMFNPSGGGAFEGASTATVTIEADPVVYFKDASYSRAENGDKFTVTLSRAGSIAAAADVTLTTVEGTATVADYVAVNRVVHWDANDGADKTVDIMIVADGAVESDEAFSAMLSAPAGVAILLPSIPLTIQDDDASYSFDMAASSVSEDGISASVPVTRFAPGSAVGAGSVSYSTANGTAMAGVPPVGDYTAVDGTVLNWNALEQGSKTAVVMITDDTVDEADQTFDITLSVPTSAGGTGVLGANPVHTTTILDNDAAPVVSIEAVNASTTEGAGPAQFRIKLVGATEQEVTVSYFTTNGTAVAGAPMGDYTAVALTPVVFAAGETEKIVPIAINNDLTDEEEETFTVNLAVGPVNATLGTSAATGTIVDNDAAPVVSIAALNDPTLENAGNAMFRASLVGATEKTVKVSYSTADGTALAGSDYTAATAVEITFASDGAPVDFGIAITNDMVDEENQTFSVNLLAAPTNATLGTATALATITDDDAAPVVSIAALNAPTNEGAGVATFGISLQGATEKVVKVSYATANGTATAGSDYTAVPVTELTFNPGDLSKIVGVAITNDLVDEVDQESFSVALSVPDNATLNPDPLLAAATGLIADNDATPKISISSQTVDETEGNVNMVFTVSIDGVSDRPITALLNTTNGSAMAPADYTAVVDGLITIPAGQTSVPTTVVVSGDVLDEDNETFTVALSALANADAGTLVGTGTITDNDATPSINVANAMVTEPAADTITLNIPVTLGAVSGRTASVAYTVTAGSAATPADYTAVNGTATIVAGQLATMIPITVNADLLDEDDETVTVTIGSPMNAVLDTSSATGTIVDEAGDVAPAVSITDATIAEGDTGDVILNFPVTLAAASGKTVTVNYSTAAVTATAGSDYTSVTNQLITFNPGELTKMAAVTVKGDLLDEANETFTATLSTPVNTTLGTAAATGTISDNDVASKASIAVGAAVAEGGDGQETVLTGTVSLDKASGLSVTVRVTTSNLTAQAGTDYTAFDQDVVIPAGMTSKTFDLIVKGDALDEADTETFRVSLPALAGAGYTNADPGAVLNVTATILDDDATPTVSLVAATVTEPATAGDTAVLNIPVNLNAVSGRAVTVSYTLTDGTAQAPADYTDTAEVTGSVTIAAGTAASVISIPVKGDLLDENAETISVTLVGATNATLGTATVNGTINDDAADVAPAVSIADAEITEGDTGEITLNFPVTLAQASGKTVTVNYSTSAGSATAGSDYTTATNQLITFNPGDLSKMATVVIKGDLLDETATETFTVTLTNLVEAAVGDLVATGTINDNDATPVLSIAAASVNETEGDTQLTFTISLTAASGLNVNVNVNTANGTATEPADYTALVNVPVMIAAGATSQTVTVTIKGDVLDEDNETLTATLSLPVNATLDALAMSALGTIVDNDATPTISVNDVTVTEGSGEIPTTATFTATLNAVSGRAVTAAYSTTDGTAKQPGDYTSSSGTLTFAPGDLTKTFTVSVNGDTTDEDNETYTVTLASLVGAVAGDLTGTGTITDDDNAPSVSIDAASVTEGTGTDSTLSFPVTLAQASGKTVTVNYSTTAGSATAGSDYTTVANGLISFAPGEISKSALVTVKADALDELNETLSVTLTTPSNTVLGTALAAGTITDDDATPKATLSVGNVTESNDGGTTTLTGTITLDAVSGLNASLSVSTFNGSALSGVDYTSVTNQTVTVLAGTTSRSFTITILGDDLDEADETFGVAIDDGNFVNVTTGATTSVTATILDNDALPTVSIAGVVGTEPTPDGSTAVINFPVSLNAISGRDVTVSYTMADGTATSADYVNASGSVTIPAGSSGVVIPVTIKGDLLDEIAETLTVTLFAPINGSLGTATATGTINDDAVDVPPTVNIAAASVTEGASGGGVVLSFPLTLTAVSGKSVTVAYSTTAGTASTADFFPATNAAVTFAPGETSKTITVGVKGEALDEVDETFTVTLSNPNPANVTLGTSSVLGTIVDDDGAPAVAFSVASSSVDEASVSEGKSGIATITATLSAASAATVKVKVLRLSGTATSPDFRFTPVTLTFAPGELSKTVSVRTLDDALNEDGETIILGFSNLSGATLGAVSAHTLTINDGDATPTVSFTAETSSAKEGSNKNVVIALSAKSGRSVSVTVSRTGGDATSGSDFNFSPVTVIFAPGQRTKTIALASIQDTTDEPDETIDLGLGSQVNAALGAPVTHTRTVVDNDLP